MKSLCKAVAVLSILAASVLALPVAARAQELSLGAPFSSGMVLQRGQPIPVWGSGKPGTAVEVKLADAVRKAKVKSDGSWRVEFAAREAETGLTLGVGSKDQRVDLVDLAIGDVLLCSGQSNMVWKMSASALGPEDRRPAIDKHIRLLTVPELSTPIEQSRFGKNATWQSASANWADFSAVCLFAGREIAKSEGVTVGLINAAFGGTPIQAWLPYEGLAMVGTMSDQMAVLDAYRRDPVAAAAVHGKVLKDLWEKLPATGRRLKGREGYANLFNGMIAPLGSTRLKGAIWYQGENNANNGESTGYYRKQLEALIASWRGRFAGKVPFVVVQLAGFGKLSGAADNDDWAAVREAQRLVAIDDPQTELVVTIDIGERLDIHPPMKKPVGQRAAAALLKIAYGKQDAYRPPEALSARRIDDRVEIAISGNKLPLFAASWGQPGPFVLCKDSSGTTCEFAAARISETGIAVAIATGSNPAIVRYCWDAAPLCNVFDQAELPLGPFELTIR